MNTREQVSRFAIEIDKVIRLFCDEYELTYLEMIGTLQFKIHQLSTEAYATIARDPDEEDDEDEDPINT